MSNKDRLPLASASNMWRNANCAGNRILERSLRDRNLIRGEETTLGATVGQKIHAALEGLPEELELSEEDVKERCETLANKCLDTCELAVYQPFYEERIFYEINRIPFFTGKPDRFYIQNQEHRALNINFKTGRKESIESHLNLQIRTEVVLIKHFRSDLVRIAAAIVEPLVNNKPEIVIYDENALKEAEREILRIVDKTEWDTNRTAGAWCEHCPCRAFCPEAKELSLQEPLYISVENLPRGEAGAKRLELIEIAKKLLQAQWEAYETIVQTELNAIPGWHISDGKSFRYIKDVERAEEIAGQLDIGLHDLIKTTLPIGKFDERIAQDTKLKGKSLKKYIDDHFWPVISKTAPSEGSLERIPKRLLE